MDSNQFDALSRFLATGISRRRALLSVGSGGLLAGLLGTLGTDAASAGRQVATACRLNLVATIRVGPRARAHFSGEVPGELRGELRFVVGPDGAIDAGQLRLEGGRELSVVGQAVGRAIYLRVSAGTGQTLVLLGASHEPIDRCGGLLDGLVTGPEGSDLGVWSATAATPGEAAPPSATPAAVATPAAIETATVAALAAGNARLESSCVCLNSWNCGNVCTDLLTDPFNCGVCGNFCFADESCLNGVCSSSIPPCPEGLEDCGGLCVNTSIDADHCGGCGIACPLGSPCFNGDCFIEPLPPCPFPQVECGDGTCAVDFSLCCDGTPEGCG